jgi:tetratricopeptide (TPR) repeat protein
MKNNPVMQRVGILTRHWSAFTANPDAKILRWCLKTDSARMIDAFLAWHNEEDSELADLFVVLPVPFEDPATYAHQLVQHISDEFQAANEDLKSMELPSGWLPAQSDGQKESCQDLIATTVSMHMHFDGLVEHIALVLMPPVISIHEDWIKWLNELASVSYWPSSVRVLVADWLPELRLNKWASEHSEVIVSQKPVLDMPGLAQEILAHLPGSGPGFDFRKLFIQIGASASEGNLNQVRLYADQALGIAKLQGWNSLGVAVQMMVAGALVAKGEGEKSVNIYREARELALASAPEDPSRNSTIITSCLALSSSLVGQGKFDEARKYYYEASKFADESNDVFTSFDSRRMASYCSEQLGDYKKALHEGQEAMRVLESMEPDERLQSTAPHLATRLMELAGKPELAKEARSVEQLCNNTLQGDWRAIADASMKA